MNIKSDNPISIKPLTNIGACLDIPTGSFITGEKGDNILNGGLGAVTGVVGLGNTFKSTFAHFLSLKSTDNMRYSKIEAPIHTYDTEDNMVFNLDRLNRLASKLTFIPENPLYDDNIWSYISKSDLPAEKWINKVHESVIAKKKDKSNLITYEGYVNRLSKGPLVLHKQSTIEIDSFSELESSATADVVEKGNIEKSNTLFMQQGLFKTKIMKDLPSLANSSNTNFIITAHVGEEINMASGPFAPQPTRQMQHMNAGLKIKGITGKLYFLSTHLYYIMIAKPLINPNTKAPEFPLRVEENSTDLNVLKIKMLRSKTGASGQVVEVVVSQIDGVLPELTEFYNIKTNKFGLVGNDRSYSVALYPNVKLSRTTVRTKLDEDVKLRRAVNIVSEMLQMKTYMRQYSRYFCTPEELYEDIKKLGYDWDYILEHTRGWYTPKQYHTDLKPLSTLDLLKIRAGEYTPYWFKNKKEK